MHPWSSGYQVARTSAKHGLRAPHCLPGSSSPTLMSGKASHAAVKPCWFGHNVVGGIWVSSAAAGGVWAELWRQTGFEVIQSHILERILDIKQSNFYKMLSFLFRIWPAAYCDEVCPISWKNALFLWEYVCPFQACPDVHTSLFLLPCWVETSLPLSEISLDLGEVQTLSKHGRKGA